MDSIRGELEGFDEYLKILKTLGDDKKVNDILKKTNREQLKPLQQLMKGLNFDQSLTKNTAIRAAKVDGQRNPTALMVGPTSDSFPLRFLEKGTVERYQKDGRYTGKITGRFLYRTLLDAQGPKLQKDVIQKYGEDLVNITAKDVKRITKKK